MAYEPSIASTAPHHLRLPSGPSMARMVAWLQDPARHLHRMIRELPGFAPLVHVSLSVYDPGADMLWAFPCAGDGTDPAEITEIDMSDAPSLVLLADGTEPRVIADLGEYGEDGRRHTAQARGTASRSCMTVPLNPEGTFLGFVMFAASRPNFFGEAEREMLLTFSEAFAILVERARLLPD